MSPTPHPQFWVAIILTKQPFFLIGINDVEVAKDNAIGAMGLFALTLVYSVYKIYFPDAEKEEEPESAGMEGYQLNSGAADYGAMS